MINWLKLRMLAPADGEGKCWVWWHATWLDEHVFGPIHDRFCANCRAATQHKDEHMQFLMAISKVLLDEPQEALE